MRCFADISAINHENKARYSSIIVCITFAQYCIGIPKFNEMMPMLVYQTNSVRGTIFLWLKVNPLLYVNCKVTSIAYNSPCGLYTFCHIAVDFWGSFTYWADLGRSLTANILAIPNFQWIASNSCSQPSCLLNSWVSVSIRLQHRYYLFHLWSPFSVTVLYCAWNRTVFLGFFC